MFYFFNFEKSNKEHATIFVIKWALLYGEQDSEEKKSKKCLPHEKKIHGKISLFLLKHINN